ncbi:MAG TPA: HEAT repeat domain-containing protein [Polyangia bacterium]|nr:HEAT repeat domain-containing protein [Polyangia bacterium]
MGLLDLFSKQGRVERARAGNIKGALNKYAQSPDRFKNLEALRDDGSEEALYGLLRRFGMMYDKSIEDEQEKDWVFETLVGKGMTVLPSLKRYLASAESISWPLRLLDKIADRETELSVLKEVLARHEPGYERDPTKKIQLLNHLAGLEDAHAPALAAPYLVDMDEGVRYAAAEALVRLKNEAAASGPLLARFVDPQEESLRLRLVIAEGFADRGWIVPAAARADIEKRMPEQYKLNKDGSVTKKAPAKE